MSRHTPGNYVPLDVNYARDASIRAAGQDAELLFIRSLAYAKGCRSKGFIPSYDLPIVSIGLRKVHASVNALVAQRLWVHSPGGWLLRSWASWNGEDEARTDERSTTGTYGNHVRWHLNEGVSESSCDHCSESLPRSLGESLSDEERIAREGKGREGRTSEAAPPTDPSLERPEVESLCVLLADLVESNGSKRPTVTQKWRDECRRMLDLDDRDRGKAERLLRWAHSSSFWRTNIKSMPKFRDQYDTLRLQATAEWEARKGGGLSPDGDVDPDLELGADSWTIPDPPDGVEPGTAAHRDWARQVRDEHKAERVAQARARLERRAG